MGRTGKWFRSIWTSKSLPESSPAKSKKKKSKWALTSSSYNSGKLNNRAEDPLASPYAEGIDANRRAVAVAAVAEAALAAAQAAAEVVRLTSGGRSGRGELGHRRLVLAAVRIQSAFRAYLVVDSGFDLHRARRALRALKGLVKLQALARGHIVRKQSADMLRHMHAMARIQARASAHRAYTSKLIYAKTGSYDSHHRGFANSRNYEGKPNSVQNGGSFLKPNHSRSRIGMTNANESSQVTSHWLSHWMEQRTSPGDRADKILEIDTWKPRRKGNPNGQNTPNSPYFSAWNDMHKPNPSTSPEDASSAGGDNHQVAGPPSVADDSPMMWSSMGLAVGPNLRRPFTPTRSECSRSLIGDHPRYRANTESSWAKVRSHSVPKQRVQLSASFGGENSDTVSERRGGGYRYSGQVRRQSTPVREAGGAGFGPVYGRRF